MTTMRTIAEDVCARRNITLAELTSTSAKRKLAHIRQEFMWLCRAVRRPDGRQRYSTPQIGAFVGRDHTTVLHGVRAYECRRAA